MNSWDITNIDRKERKKRVIFGSTALGSSFLLLGVFYLGHVNENWSLILSPLLFLGALGLFQANQRICVALAFKETCSFGQGEEKIGDPEKIKLLKEESIKIILKALLVAISGTVLSYVILPS